MRPLTTEESKAVFKKLAKYIGPRCKELIDKCSGINGTTEYCFRYHRQRIFYSSAMLAKRASSIKADNLLSFGICIGKFTKTHQFILKITSLHVIAPLFTNRMWLKPAAEQRFLYGRNIEKTGLARMTDTTQKYDGILMVSMNEVPLGFGLAAKSSTECRNTDPGTCIAFHQADVGEFIRNEDTLL
ncbi:60S ribosome subunit biogenesis protein NIP7 [Intoshia linei]|uniref:60S ribosome subunit biogenesis protein NIP7 homolog n=1 Tax=Intoshia linei TaxID=1819745 RepID=A0A177BAK7_9BILA|nr:60S ribosome subunit biogenesis protein NIP7 [Intoshia linei]